MRLFAATLFGVCLAAGVMAQQEKIVFQAKNGNVTFDHAAHVKSAGNDCAACHDKLFPKSNTAPINFKANIHKTAEAAMTSCGACHHPGGKAFETKGNCGKCHVKG